ncbi:glycosyltransferase family 39 protein [candidate division KSB1 bacterium]|nr:glycosyltransferase family 39 protein [candidate division KSB1 bacterium]
MNITQKVLQFIGIFLFCYLFLMAVNFKVNVYLPLYTVTFGFIIYLLCKNLSKLSEKNAKQVIIILLIIGTALRFLWAVYIPTIPVSDFLYYHDYATRLAHGDFISHIGKNLGFSYLLSLGYRIYPALITTKLINAFASTLSLVLLSLLAYRLTSVSVALFTTLLFSFFPTEINMVSVTGTEIIITTVMIAIAYFLLREFINGLTLKNMFFAGSLFGLGLTIRSSIAFYIPACFIFIFLSPAKKILQRTKSLIQFLSGIILIWLLFFILNTLFVIYISVVYTFNCIESDPL